MIVQGGIGIIDPFHIGPEKTRKFDMTTCRLEFRVFDSDRDGLKSQLGFRHLRGNGSLPDHSIQSGFTSAQTLLFSGFHFGTGRPDRLVGLLSILGFGRVLPRFRAQIIFAIAIQHRFASGIQRLLRQIDTVGSHIGNVSVFVQTLCNPHGISSGEAELTIRFLLQCTGRERGIRFSGL